MSNTVGQERVARPAPERWVLGRRSGGDDRAGKQTDRAFEPVREHVSSLARTNPCDRNLDIAARDGYIGLGSIDRAGFHRVPRPDVEGGRRGVRFPKSFGGAVRTTAPEDHR